MANIPDKAIEAAAKSLYGDHGRPPSGEAMRMAKNAITAALPFMQQQFDRRCFKDGERAGIEAAAKECDEGASKIEAQSHQDDASRLAAEMLRKASAAIRALVKP